MPNLERLPDAIITNPPFGQGGRLATAFIEAGLARIGQVGGLLALLLPCDFSARGPQNLEATVHHATPGRAAAFPLTWSLIAPSNLTIQVLLDLSIGLPQS